jgi:hypothetical protein
MALETIIALTLIGTSVAVGTASAIEKHQADKQQADIAEENARLQMQQMEYNRKVEEREAAALEAEGRENDRRMREAAAEARAQRIAMLGKSGAAMTSGSPLAVLGEAAAEEELAIQDARYQRAREISAVNSKAADYTFGSAIAEQNLAAAKASRPSGFGLAMNITGAAISPLVNYANYQKAGTAVVNDVKGASSAVKSIIA